MIIDVEITSVETLLLTRYSRVLIRDITENKQIKNGTIIAEMTTKIIQEVDRYCKALSKENRKTIVVPKLAIERTLLPQKREARPRKSWGEGIQTNERKECQNRREWSMCLKIVK